MSEAIDATYRRRARRGGPEGPGPPGRGGEGGVDGRDRLTGREQVGQDGRAPLRFGGGVRMGQPVGPGRSRPAREPAGAAPPSWLPSLLGTTPPAVERIGIARAYASTAGGR